MAFFGQDLLKGFLRSDYLKDYKHASNVFRSAGYSLAPKFKFLFHVHFNLNTSEIPNLLKLQDASRLSVLVKSVKLPDSSINVKTENQYNRKRLIQTGVTYNPVTINFHDDGGDLVRNLWFQYCSYYYRDPSQAIAPSSDKTDFSIFTGKQPIKKISTARDAYSDIRNGGDEWGYIGEDSSPSSVKPQFFKDITIYGLNQHSFVSYTMVNPMIKAFSHDTYDYSAGGETMGHTMEIMYESILYGAGAVNGKTGAPIPGFAQPGYYDKTPSPLSRPGSTSSILGPGGFLDAGTGIANDLASGNFIGAGLTAARAYDTASRTNLKAAIIGEGTALIKESLLPSAQQTNAGVISFPTLLQSRPATNVQSQVPQFSPKTE